jgi:hypothetical protein
VFINSDDEKNKRIFRAAGCRFVGSGDKFVRPYDLWRSQTPEG